MYDRFGLTRVINARGTYTPLGVSRSTEGVREAVSEALAGFYIVEELQAVASRYIGAFTGAEAGTVVHCASAAITLSIAASMAGLRADRIEALPDTTGMDNRAVLPAGHAVDYGHPILQDIRLAGAQPVLAGTDDACSMSQLEDALSEQFIACLVLVSSRLTRGEPVSIEKAVAAAHRRGVPAIIDGAAQDMRIGELLATGADLVLISAQKYLRAPTAGLVIGRSEMVAAVRAQEKGIGRSMKASKEGILGALAALQERKAGDLDDWQEQQARKVSDFASRADRISDISALVVPDRAGMPFPRVRLQFESANAMKSAGAAASYLRSGNPSVWVMEDEIDQGALVLELVPLDEDEINTVLVRLAEFIS